MSSRLHSLLLLAARSDARASLQDGHWQTGCLHCRSQIGITVDGKPWPGTTLEHIVPRSWFGRSQAESLVVQVENADDPRNLALACARCNHQKGRGPDARGPANARAYAIVERLLATRMSRWRAPDQV